MEPGQEGVDAEEHQVVAEQGHGDGDEEGRARQDSARQAVELGKGIVGSTQGVEHRELVPSLAVEHDLREVPHHGGDQEQADSQGQDHGAVVLEALDARLEVVARRGDQPILEGGDHLAELILGGADGVHVGSCLHVDLQLGAGGGAACQSGVGGITHAKEDAVLGVQPLDHSADREGLVAELEILDLPAEQLLGIENHLQRHRLLADRHDDLVTGLEIIGLLVVDVLADDDTVGVVQNGIGISLEGTQTVADDVVDPDLVRHGTIVVVHRPLEALGFPLLAGYGVITRGVELIGLEEEMGLGEATRQADAPLGVAHPGDGLQLGKEHIHILADLLVLLEGRCPGLVADDLVLLGDHLFIVIGGSVGHQILVGIQLIVEGLHFSNVQARDEEGGKENRRDDQTDVVFPHTPEAVQLILPREGLPEQEEGAAGRGNKPRIVPRLQMTDGRLLGHTPHGEPDRGKDRDQSAQERHQHPLDGEPQTHAPRDVEEPRDEDTHQGSGDKGQGGDRDQLAARRAHELGEVGATGHVDAVNELEVIQADEEEDHHHEDREGEPDEGHRPELHRVGSAEVLGEGVQGGQADLTAILRDTADHVVVDLLVGRLQAEGIVQQDAAGVGAVS